MKYIDRKFMLISIIVAILITLSGCTNLNYKEDNIYSENILIDYKNNYFNEGERNHIGREEAIEKALKILRDGFGISLDRKSMYESIRLEKYNNKLAWQISFSEVKKGKKIKYYYICIAAEDGAVIEVALDDYEKIARDNIKNINIYDEENKINIESIKKIINPLCELFNIRLDEYTINVKENNKLEVILNKESVKVEYFVFEIDKATKSIITFVKM